MNNFTRSTGIVSQLKDMYVEQIMCNQPKNSESNDSDSDGLDDADNCENDSICEYKIRTRMSSNLKKLIGMQLDDSDHVNNACSIFSFWKAPDAHGLKNSERKCNMHRIVYRMTLIFYRLYRNFVPTSSYYTHW